MCFVEVKLILILAIQKGQKYTRLLHSLLKIDSLNVAKGEVTHGDWKFKSAFMDVLI